MKAIVVHKTGGPEQLQFEEIDFPTLGSGEVLVHVHFSGVNYIDTYHRTGLYPVEPPFTPGMEAVGIVEAVGSKVTEVAVGDRVAYAMCRGSYAEYALVPAGQLAPVPDGVSDEIAAAVPLQGMTAHYLTHSTWPIKPGDTCLVHAAAGGAGQLVAQMAKIRGARVFGTTSTQEKAELARAAGCDEVILYTEQDFAAEVKRLTGGKGLDVVYDSVGASTWDKSLASLRPRGMMVSYGNSSGAVPPFSPLVLSQKGSLFLTRPTLAHYTSTREEVLARCGDIFGWLAEGKLRVHIHKVYPLADAAQAHRDLEGRKTAGKLLLKP